MGFQPVPRALGVDQRPLEVPCRLLGAVLDDVAHDAQRPGQALVVAECLELVDQRVPTVASAEP